MDGGPAARPGNPAPAKAARPRRGFSWPNRPAGPELLFLFLGLARRDWSFVHTYSRASVPVGGLQMPVRAGRLTDCGNGLPRIIYRITADAKMWVCVL